LGPLTINALARELVMDRTTLGRTMLPLERDGLIRVANSSVDRRSKELRLTKLGEAQLREAGTLWVQAQKEFERKFGASRASRLRDELHAIVATPLGSPIQ
jgi:DNA-binding MarR family transcriptional regulator